MKVICIVGRSSSGKDTIYRKVLDAFGEALKPIITWTTRDMRKGEVDGVDYHFSNDKLFQKQLSEGKVVEYRVYNSFGRILTYYTCADDFDDSAVYIAVTSLAQVNKYSAYFGSKNVYPVHVQLEDRVLLERALNRCDKSGESYKEVCRRYISDCEEWENNDFADGLKVFRVHNDILDDCCEKVCKYIREVIGS